MPALFDADLELLSATALRHTGTVPPRTTVHLSAAIDALTDPLAPPQLAGVAPRDTANLRQVLQEVRHRLQRLAQQAPDPQQTLAIATAARELTHALDALGPARRREP